MSRFFEPEGEREQRHHLAPLSVGGGLAGGSEAWVSGSVEEGPARETVCSDQYSGVALKGSGSTRLGKLQQLFSQLRRRIEEVSLV